MSILCHQGNFWSTCSTQNQFATLKWRAVQDAENPLIHCWTFTTKFCKFVLLTAFSNVAWYDVVVGKATYSHSLAQSYTFPRSSSSIAQLQQTKNARKTRKNDYAIRLIVSVVQKCLIDAHQFSAQRLLIKRHAARTWATASESGMIVGKEAIVWMSVCKLKWNPSRKLCVSRKTYASEFAERVSAGTMH